MAENKTNAADIPTPAEVRLEEYKPFRELDKKEIKKLDTVLTTLEKRVTKYGTSIIFTIDLHEQFSKVTNNAKIIDERDYNIIVSLRNDFNPEEGIHYAQLPVRYLVRHDEEGNVKYRRVEVGFHRDKVVSVFMDFKDEQLLEVLGMMKEIKWIEDKDASEAHSVAKAEASYEFY